MKKTILMTLAVFMFVFVSFSQSNTDKPVMLTETMYIMPKQGMEDRFEAAIKVHNDKFHPEGPYKAGLRKVEYGEKAGWYVWVFGPTTYASLDTRPAKEGGHAADWSATVDPLVEAYGETQLWNYNEDLSYGMDKLYASKYYEVWNVKINRGEFYRFKALAEKLKKAYESMGKSAFIVFYNPLHTSNSGDVGIVWSFNSYAQWIKDDGVKDAYEKLYGANSWQNMMDEWYDVTKEYDSEIRSFVK